MNTEVKHTPGPWKVSKKFVVGPVDQEDSQSYGMIVGVADVYGDNRDDDAHLIAAAPELLEALDLARKYMKLCLGSSFWDGPNPYPIIDAALAKARGEVDA